jgi:nucleoside-diphosphate-sugar epimerase
LKNILITGGAGFIGSYTVDLAIKNGFTVTVIDNLSLSEKPNKKENLEFIEGDVRDVHLVSDQVKRASGGVIHLAADSRVLPSVGNAGSAVASVETNVLGTLNILRSIVDSGLRRPLVYAASSTAYGNMPSPQVEGMLPHTQTPYAAGKLSGEFLIRSFCETFSLTATCLRYFQVYGPGQPSSGAYALVTGIFAKQFLSDDPLTIEGSGLQSRDFVHVKDVAIANLLALRHQLNGQPINIGTGKSTTILDLAQMFGSEIVKVPARRIDLIATCADTSLATELLGFKSQERIENWVNSVKDVKHV